MGKPPDRKSRVVAEDSSPTSYPQTTPDVQRGTTDPMHLHQTMLEVHKELTTNTAVLNRAVLDLDKQSGKMDGLIISFAWFKGVFAASAFLMFVFAGLVWWLVGSQIGDLKNELLRRTPTPVAQSKSP